MSINCFQLGNELRLSYARIPCMFIRKREGKAHMHDDRLHTDDAPGPVEKAVEGSAEAGVVSVE